MKKVIMKYKKSELNLFLQERIRENKEELSRNLEATLQYELKLLGRNSQRYKTLQKQYRKM